MTVIMEECEASTDVLQSQVDEARQRSQRELDELRRQLQDKSSELDKTRQAAKRLQDEVGRPRPSRVEGGVLKSLSCFTFIVNKHPQLSLSPDVGLQSAGRDCTHHRLVLLLSARPQLLPLEEDLRRCRREQQEAQQRGRQLEQKVEELEERSAVAVGDRERQIKLMEVIKSSKYSNKHNRNNHLFLCFFVFFLTGGDFKEEKSGIFPEKQK